MFASSYDASQMVVLVVIAVLQVAALVILWTDTTRATGWKAIWTAAIVRLPPVGPVGFFINRGLAVLARRLQHDQG